MVEVAGCGFRQTAFLSQCTVLWCLDVQDYWTNKQLNEVKFVPRLGNSNATNVRINGTETLWVSSVTLQSTRAAFCC